MTRLGKAQRSDVCRNRSTVEAAVHAAMAPPAMTPIDSAMSDLESQASALGELIENLEARLARVLLPRVPCGVAQDRSDPKQPESPLLSRLKMVTQQLNSVAVHVREISDYLEC